MNNQRATAMSIIRRRRREIRYPLSAWSRDEFDQASYSKWAISELINYISKNPSTPPIILVEEFAKKMDDYSCMNQSTSLIFSIARDAIIDVLDTLITM